MKYRVLVEEPAWQDIEAAYEWLRARVPEQAVRWFNALEEAIVVGLATNPERCPRAVEAEEVGRDIRSSFTAGAVAAIASCSRFGGAQCMSSTFAMAPEPR